MVYGDEFAFAGQKVDKELTRFLEIIPKGADDNWMREFTVFQFAYYSTLRIRFDRVFFHWIYGKKALARWNKRSKEQIYYANKYKLKLGIRKKLESLSAKAYMAQERLRFTDEARRFLHCHNLALFDNDHAFCQHCAFYKSCQENGL